MGAVPLVPTDRMVDLGLKLRGYRTMRDMSLVELAAWVAQDRDVRFPDGTIRRVLGVPISASRLADFERGAPPGLRVAEFFAVCEALQVYCDVYVAIGPLERP